MKKIDYLYTISFAKSKDIRFDPKVVFNEFKQNIKKIVDPLQRALYCQQSILKTFYVDREINSDLNECEFDCGSICLDMPWFKKGMKLEEKVGYLCMYLVKFYEEEIKSPTNNFSSDTQQLLLESLKVYRICSYGEKVVEIKNANLQLVVNEPDDYNQDQIVSSQQYSNN
jgi:hypothetical protein